MRDRREETRIHSVSKKDKTRGRRHTERQKRSRLTGTLICVVLSVICFITLDGFMTSAHGDVRKEPETFQVYESITVESGDTLWDLAEEYRSEEESVTEYVHILQEINSLSGDTIKAGDRIIVVYNNTTAD